jgi:hypothetical protein
MWMLMLSIQYGCKIGVSAMSFWIRQELMGRHCWIKVMMLLLSYLMVMVMMTLVVTLLQSAWTKTS